MLSLFAKAKEYRDKLPQTLVTASQQVQLWVEVDDKPGMIGKVGTFLGKHGINIAAMDVGRVKVGEKAVMVLNVDSEVPESTLKEIAKIEGIQGAKLVKV